MSKDLRKVYIFNIVVHKSQASGCHGDGISYVDGSNLLGLGMALASFHYSGA